MKILSYNVLSAFAALLFITACSKNEPAAVKEESARLEKRQLSVPLADGRTAIELKDWSKPAAVRTQQFSYANEFTVFENPDETYLNATTLMSLDKPANFSIINCVADNKLKLTFVDSLIKMPGYPNGWTALWNTAPFVERESPTVLYTRQQNRLTILLSKYVEVFGFELSPNLYDAYEFSTGFYDSRQNSPVASVVQVATTPSGARLFAVKSEKPFNVIEINFTGGEGTTNHPYGFAIANIRYKLCKDPK